jgi:galactokinase
MEITTPGRICLFGEHSDYLGLPIIAMAISLRAKISGHKRTDNQVIIHKPDINETERFSIEDLHYTKSRDYFKSCIKTCQNEGLIFSSGFECEVSSQIPIRAGASSSSAINVSWIHFLSKMADNPIEWTQEKIGKLTYQAESTEFNEPGGMMDQYTTAMGHIIHLESEPNISIQSLNPKLGSFVLGDSDQPKDTMGILKRLNDSRVEILNILRIKNPKINIHTMNSDINLSDLNNEQRKMYKGTVENRDLLKKALVELKNNKPNYELIGTLLTELHVVLRDIFDISTPKIESMLDAAMNAGALGGKITGSGGGGCMFAYAPDHPEKVAEAIEKVGGKAYIVYSDDGTKFL